MRKSEGERSRRFSRNLRGRGFKPNPWHNGLLFFLRKNKNVKIYFFLNTYFFSSLYNLKMYA